MTLADVTQLRRAEEKHLSRNGRFTWGLMATFAIFALYCPH